MRTSQEARARVDASTLGPSPSVNRHEALRPILRLLAVRAQVIIGRPLERNG
jgi:hypothetical protein